MHRHLRAAQRLARLPTGQNQTDQIERIGQTRENSSQYESSSTEPAADVTPLEQDNGQGGRDQLTAQKQQQVEELKQRDRTVRAHEQAHLAAAG